jgi:hypothetical protein
MNDLPASPISWFPNLSAGLPFPIATHVEALVTAAWTLAIDGRALIEDFEGGAEESFLIDTLKLKLIEFLLDLDLILRGVTNIDEEHLLPLALERGLSEVARLDGAGLVAAIGLGANDDYPNERIHDLWSELLAAFPAEVPNPLLADGQGPLLRALRNWSKFCRAAEVTDTFLTKLIKAI